ncbi:BsuPI-related putative proteinase inhibitor [Niallia nealsonii]|uniref:Intracellular proteinase inhibitor BsuPI domain-containing protein n=1 Tax=Niallia nealsonii TaxID=115979 RepID=A0A2N0Z7P1_9BACI|nr:BsuPI-related putative proteinase inhibitor [Niallia nealsonii]PKG25503.1 hypothetical protein CWS01_01265 [Niallia nealsonii]
MLKKAFFMFIVYLLIAFPFANDIFAKASSLSLEMNALPRTDDMEIELKLTNNSSQRQELRFSSSQKYEIAIKSLSGEEVYRYSFNKLFTQAIQRLAINPRESLVWKERWDYKNNGQRVEPGDYIVEAELLPMALTDPAELMIAKATIAISEENRVFKNIQVKGEKGKYTITGIADTKNNLLYTIEDGHNELISKQWVTKKRNGTFTIHVEIPEQDLPKNGTLILYLIEEAANYDKPYPIELEKF